MALDCAAPSPLIVRLILDAYPEAAFRKTKDGLLPLHCAISCVNPIVEVIESLLQIFPESPEHLAMDIVPMDEYADPDTWEGDWKEKRWTPLSRAIDRRLDPCVALFKAALNDSLKKGRMGSPVKVISTFTAKRIMPGPMPPINAAIQEGSQEGSQAEGPSDRRVPACRRRAAKVVWWPRLAGRRAGTDRQVVLPDDVQEEQEEVEIGANGLPVLKIANEEDEHAARYGYGKGYGPRDDHRGGREICRERLDKEDRRRDRDSSRRHRRSPHDRDRGDGDETGTGTGAVIVGTARAGIATRTGTDTAAAATAPRAESLAAIVAIVTAMNARAGAGEAETIAAVATRATISQRRAPPRRGRRPLPTRGESKGGDNDSNQTPERKGGDTKYFVAGSHKSPKEPPQQ